MPTGFKSALDGKEILSIKELRKRFAADVGESTNYDSIAFSTLRAPTTRGLFGGQKPDSMRYRGYLYGATNIKQISTVPHSEPFPTIALAVAIIACLSLSLLIYRRHRKTIIQKQTQRLEKKA